MILQFLPNFFGCSMSVQGELALSKVGVDVSEKDSEFPDQLVGPGGDGPKRNTGQALPPP